MLRPLPGVKTKYDREIQEPGLVMLGFSRVESVKRFIKPRELF